METFLWMPELEWRDGKNKIRNRWTCGKVWDKQVIGRHYGRPKLLKNNQTSKGIKSRWKRNRKTTNMVCWINCKIQKTAWKTHILTIR